MTVIMTYDQEVVYDWIAIEKRDGWNRQPIPFTLDKFRHIRDQLVRAGFVMKTTTGRYVPVPDKPRGPGKPVGQAERPLERIA